jgi:quinol---cytochrome c reductase cytochrome b subunit, bacillus type
VNVTARAQGALRNWLSLEDALPTRMPVYVNSVVYLFGAMALAALAMLVATGTVIAVFGPTWWHVSRAGHFLNSLHFWSTQLFFLSILLHLVGKFFMAAWRGGRWGTWVVGLLSLAVAAFSGLTGFILQTNWDSQWIAGQAKDALNALGVGAVVNTMNTGQILTLHVVVLPLFVIGLVAFHVLLVRHEGPVRPIGSEDDA